MMTNKMKRDLRTMVKAMCNHGISKAALRLPEVHHAINERVVVGQLLDAVTDSHQMVCRVVSGMDCDCVQYCRSTVYQRRSLIQEWWDVNNIYDGAEGPINVGFTTPSKKPESFSHDLIAEAHENGHPHVVYTH